MAPSPPAVSEETATVLPEAAPVRCSEASDEPGSQACGHSRRSGQNFTPW